MRRLTRPVRTNTTTSITPPATHQGTLQIPMTNCNCLKLPTQVNLHVRKIFYLYKKSPNSGELSFSTTKAHTCSTQKTTTAHRWQCQTQQRPPQPHRGSTPPQAAAARALQHTRALTKHKHKTTLTPRRRTTLAAPPRKRTPQPIKSATPMQLQHNPAPAPPQNRSAKAQHDYHHWHMVVNHI